jgi:transposase
MKYLMGDKERARLTLIKGAIDGVYTVGYVAKVLGIKTRRVKSLKKAVRQQGDEAVIHGNSRRHPKNYTDEKIQERIILLKKNSDYFDTNFTYFRELLEERENIKIGYTALSKILRNAGIISKKTHSNGGKKCKRRKRRSQFGELLQADATPFDWFGTGVRLALHGFIDDATGRLVGLYMCQNEYLQGYLETLRQTLSK